MTERMGATRCLLCMTVEVGDVAGDRSRPVWSDFESMASARLHESVRLAAAIVGPDDAPDVVQDAFVEAWRHIDRLRDPAAFDPWLRSIVVNRCRNVLRTRDRRVRTIDLAAAGAVVGETGDESGLRAEQRDRLDRAFHRLSADHRAVLALRYTLDLQVRDIALTLHVPEGTVKSRLNAAITRLRVAVGEEST